MDRPGSADTNRLPLGNIRVTTADERITISYALSDLMNPESVRYRTRLMPIESQFSSWTATGQQSLVDVQAGQYELLIEGRDSAGNTEALAVTFHVEPQWFESGAARSVYVLLTLVTGFYVLRYIANRRARRLKRENVLLEEKVAART